MNEALSSPAVPKRLVCVDALRGFDMLWIIGGGDIIISLSKAYPSGFTGKLAEHFDHQWGTFHFYDIIMPLFLFIVGVVMPVAFKNRQKNGQRKPDIYRHAMVRVLKLYVLGLIASGHLLTLDITKIHLWTDTLHAIAVGYIVSTVLILELRLVWQLVVTGLLLVLYWLIMALVPVPGHGAGIYEPTVNLALYIDNRVLGHFQEGEGWTYILTNMTFVCSVMGGVFAGQILLSDKPGKKKALILSVIGICCLLAGKIWGIWFPIIHHLWTSSLVLYAGGWSYLLLALFYLVIDVWGYKKWAFPFKVIGMNAIAVYVATHLFDFRNMSNVFTGGLARWTGSAYGLIQSIAALLVIYGILYWMYQKKTFIKI